MAGEKVCVGVGGGGGMGGGAEGVGVCVCTYELVNWIWLVACAENHFKLLEYKFCATEQSLRYNFMQLVAQLSQQMIYM